MWSPPAFQRFAEASTELVEFYLACVLVNVGICGDDALSIVGRLFCAGSRRRDSETS